MGIVRLKISGHELIKNEDPKWVLDKVRAQRHFSVTSDNVESPPSNEERLSISREIQGHCEAVADPKEGPWGPDPPYFWTKLRPEGPKKIGGRPPPTPYLWIWHCKVKWYQGPQASPMKQTMMMFCNQGRMGQGFRFPCWKQNSWPSLPRLRNIIKQCRLPDRRRLFLCEELCLVTVLLWHSNTSVICIL